MHKNQKATFRGQYRDPPEGYCDLVVVILLLFSYN